MAARTAAKAGVAAGTAATTAAKGAEQKERQQPDAAAHATDSSTVPSYFYGAFRVFLEQVRCTYAHTLRY